VTSLKFAELEGPPGEQTAPIAARVDRARLRQLERQGKVNSALTPAELRQVAPLDAPPKRLLARAVDHLGLTGRAYDRVVRVARTLADLAMEPAVGAEHVAEALQFRGDDRFN
jgi:magnesium chelatase family protein